MAFRFEARGSLRRQPSRLARKELNRALRALATSRPDSDAIHQARKSVKMVRALLRLIGYHGKTKPAHIEQLRLAAHRLAGLRDADAIFATLELLQSESPGVLTATTLRLPRLALEARRQDARARAGRAITGARTALASLAEQLPDRVEGPRRVRELHAGVAKGYRRAWKAMRGLSPDSSVTRFHRWRRRVKEHWYHIRLIQDLDADAKVRAGKLKKLETLLGEAHNLALLRAVILAGPERFGDGRTRALLLGCIDQSQFARRTQALATGHRLFTSPE